MLVLWQPNTRSNQASTSPRSGAWKLGWYIRVTRNCSVMVTSLSKRLLSPWLMCPCLMCPCLPRLGAGDAEVLAQGRPGVLPPEHAPPLQLGHHHPDELLEGAGQVGGREHEPVAAAGVEPLLHLVRHRRGGADEARALQQGGAVCGQVADGHVAAEVLAHPHGQAADP